MVREANKGDLNQLLRLYTHLHEEGIPDDEMKLEKVLLQILIIEVTVMLQLVLNMQKKLLHLRIVTK